jgi:predicted ATPase
LLDKLFTRKRIRLDPSALVVESESKDQIPLQGLSSGEKQLLRLLIQTLDTEECSLLIDEPELSMHIDWQRELVAAMHSLNPRMQLIVATHSPEIMADVEDQFISEL